MDVLGTSLTVTVWHWDVRSDTQTLRMSLVPDLHLKLTAQKNNTSGSREGQSFDHMDRACMHAYACGVALLFVYTFQLRLQGSCLKKNKVKIAFCSKNCLFADGKKTRSANQQNDWSELEWLLAASPACVINLTALGQHL